MADFKYLFCITTGQSVFVPEGIGLGIGPVLVERSGPLAAVYCDVPVEDFVGEDSEARLKDLAWIAPRATRHEEVIVGVMKSGPVMPIRFGTVFSSLERMKESLESIGDKVVEFLEFISDKDEWDVQGFVEKTGLKKKLQEILVAESSTDMDKLPTGKRYFMEQRLKAGAEKKLAESLGVMSKITVDRLGKLSTDFAERRLIGKEISGGETDMFFHGAFLVRKSDAHGFMSAVNALDLELSDQGYSFVISGPWPPYSFSPALSGGS